MGHALSEQGIKPAKVESVKMHAKKCNGWLVVLGFNATLTAKVISRRSVTHMCFLAFLHQYLHNLSFQCHRLLFSHASAEVGGENTPERKVASTGDRTHNHVRSPTHSPLSHQGGQKSTSEVRSFLGLVNYKARYIPDLQQSKHHCVT